MALTISGSGGGSALDLLKGELLIHVGDGSSGVNNPTVLTFREKPKAIKLLLYAENDTTFIGHINYQFGVDKIDDTYKAYKVSIYYGSSSYSYRNLYMKYENNSLYIYSKDSSYSDTNAEYQLNKNGWTYYLLVLY